MAHGYYGADETLGRSSLITAQEIRDSGFDYLALGHIHRYQDVSQGDTRAVYPGSPASWLSSEPSVAFAWLDPAGGVNVEPVPIQV
jgi:DNA repair exonuclease SbcCD nuclease subunit